MDATFANSKSAVCTIEYRLYSRRPSDRSQPSAAVVHLSQPPINRTMTIDWTAVIWVGSVGKCARSAGALVVNCRHCPLTSSESAPRRPFRLSKVLSPRQAMSELHHECGIAAIYHLPGETVSPLCPEAGPGRGLAADAADAARHAEPRPARRRHDHASTPPATSSSTRTRTSAPSARSFA